MKYIRDRIRSILALDDPPDKLALAFSLGVFVAFTPTIGLHTLSCLFLAWIFRVSRIVTLTGSFINNPWTIVPLYGFCLWFGIKITGSTLSSPHIAWNEIGFSNAYLILKPFLWPFIAGTLVLGVVASVISYFLFYRAAIRYRKIQKS
jgi:uncharacterized protein (DUF2062 family)